MIQHGVLGRSMPSRFDARTLWLSRYLTPVGYTAPPPSDDWTGPEHNYTFLGNDSIGCCTRTVYGHMIQQRCALLGEVCALTAHDVIKSYADGTGYDGSRATDKGDQIINALVQLKREGFHNGRYKIRGYGRVNHKDQLEMRAALRLFGSLIVGASLPANVWKQRNTWELPPIGQRTPDDAPGSAGGHAFLFTGHEHLRWFGMPWIDRVTMNDAWADLYVDEAWFVVDDLWVTKTRRAPNGFDLERLEHDVAALAAA